MNAATGEIPRTFRFLIFALTYLLVLLIAGVLGDCFVTGRSVGYYALYGATFPMGLTVLFKLNLPFSLAGHVVYAAHILWGLLTRRMAVFRRLLVSFVAILVVNIGSCVSHGGCFNGF